MRIVKKFLLVILLLTVAVMGFAKDSKGEVIDKGKTFNLELQLLHLKAIKTADASGDKLYMGVAVYPSSGKPDYYLVPKFPLFWASRQLDTLKNVRIWSDKLQNNQSITLVLSLMEQDAPPWNTDDLIGSVQLRLYNKNGVLESNWDIPNRADAPTSVMSKYGSVKLVHLLGNKANYHMYFLLKH